MNLAAANISLERVCLSANWMTDIRHPGEAAALYTAVEAISMELCPELGISIPVGKDSTSMSTAWKEKDTQDQREVTAPLTLIVSAFCPVKSIRHWTPTLRQEEDVGETVLILVDLSRGKKAMGGSALAQAFGQIGTEAPDVRDVQLLKDFLGDAVEQLHHSDIVLAYHDISDGGLFTAVAEMIFAGRCGVNLMIDSICKSVG